MKRNRWSLRLVGVVLLLGLGSSAEAANYLANCVPNGIILGSEMVIGYHDPAAPPAPVLIPPPAPLANLVHVVAAPVVVVSSMGAYGIVTAGPITKLPLGGGLAKDQVVGRFSSEFEYALPVGTRPLDSFRLRANGSGSAVAAFDLAMGPADALVQGRATAEFFVDTLPAGTPLPPPPNCAGTVFLPPLRPLAPHEVVLQLTVLRAAGGVMVPIYTQVPGGPPATVAIGPAALYRVVLDYTLRVPHGVDPSFDVDLEITVNEEVPAPGLAPFGLALVALGFLAVGGGLLLRGRARIR